MGFQFLIRQFPAAGQWSGGLLLREACGVRLCRSPLAYPLVVSRAQGCRRSLAWGKRRGSLHFTHIFMFFEPAGCFWFFIR